MKKILIREKWGPISDSKRSLAQARHLHLEI